MNQNESNTDDSKNEKFTMKQLSNYFDNQKKKLEICSAHQLFLIHTGDINVSLRGALRRHKSHSGSVVDAMGGTCDEKNF